MISIKRLLDQRQSEPSSDRATLQACLQMGQRIIDGAAVHAVPGREADLSAFRDAMAALSRRLDEPISARDLTAIGADAVQNLLAYAQATSAHFGGQNENLQSMIAMLTATVASISGQSDATIQKLQSVEQEIEMAAGSDDLGEVRERLEHCLTAVRDAVAQQRRATASTISRLEHELESVQTNRVPNIVEVLGESARISDLMACDYIAMFQLRQGARIARRFGHAATLQMLTVMREALLEILGPTDRLLRRGAAAFVMLIDSEASLSATRTRLALAVSRVRHHHVELGESAALLKVVLDWVLLPRSQFPSPEAVSTALDAFFSNGGTEPIPASHPGEAVPERVSHPGESTHVF